MYMFYYDSYQARNQVCRNAEMDVVLVLFASVCRLRSVGAIQWLQCMFVSIYTRIVKGMRFCNLFALRVLGLLVAPSSDSLTVNVLAWVAGISGSTYDLPKFTSRPPI